MHIDDDTINALVAEIGNEYFSSQEIDDEAPCWMVNPFLWTLFCASTGRELSFPKDDPLTEKGCLVYFLHGFAAARLARIMFEKEYNIVH